MEDIPAAPADSTSAETIARLTAERDAARYERELEVDYREALLRDLDVVSTQLKEAQRRLMVLDQTSASQGDTPGARGGREFQLERELEEARARISELEARLVQTPPAPVSRNEQDMMDVFLQFVELQDRQDDSHL